VPDAFIAAGQAAAQGFIDWMVWMAREAVVIINSTIGKINNLLAQSGIGSRLGTLGAPVQIIPRPIVDIGGGGATERLRARLSDVQKQIADIRASDPLGDFYTSVQDHALQNAKDRLAQVGDAAKGAGQKIKDAALNNVAAWRQFNQNLDAAKQVVSGFFSSLRDGLRRRSDGGARDEGWRARPAREAGGRVRPAGDDRGRDGALARPARRA